MKDHRVRSNTERVQNHQTDLQSSWCERNLFVAFKFVANMVEMGVEVEGDEHEDEEDQELGDDGDDRNDENYVRR